jgi:hypothetical protein
VTAYHACDIELFQHDYAVALGESCGLNVQEVLPLPPHLAVDTSNVELSFGLIPRPFLTTRNNTLCVGQALQGSTEMLWIGDHVSVRSSSKEHNATIDGNDGICSRYWVWDLNLARDVREPLITISTDRAGLGLAFKWSMDDSSQVTEFWESQDGTVEAPDLLMWLTDTQEVSTLFLPSWSSSELLKAPLPSLIQLNEKLGTDVTWNISKPGQLLTKFSQFVYLIKGRVVPLLATAPRKPEQSLFKSKIPKGTKCVLPGVDSFYLLRRRVDPVTERLMYQHNMQYMFNRTQCQMVTNALSLERW